MPTLKRSSDGHFYVHHFYKDHATWQLNREGARFLEFLGIKEDSKFETALFMELYETGLVSTASNRNRVVTRSLADRIPPALRQRAEEFHRAAGAGGPIGRDRCLVVLGELSVVRQALEPHLVDRWTKSTWKIKFGFTSLATAGPAAEFGFVGVDFSWDRAAPRAIVAQHWALIRGAWNLFDVPEWRAQLSRGLSSKQPLLTD